MEEKKIRTLVASKDIEINKELGYHYIFATAAVILALGITYWLIARKIEE